VPYYSQCIANYIVKRHKELNSSNVTSSSSSSSLTQQQQQPPRLRMVELGGGRGTHALAVLDHLERIAPAIYETCTYTLLEASPTLHTAQQQQQQAAAAAAAASQSRRRRRNHGGKLYTHQLDLYTLAMSSTTTSTDPEAEFRRIATAMQSDDHGNDDTADPCHVVVMGLEILDNLPHDKIRLPRPAGSSAVSTGMTLEQAELVPCANGTTTTSDDNSASWQEVFQPLSDPLLQRVLQHYPVHLVSPHTQTVWIPTVACEVLGVLARLSRTCCAHTTILLADFDSFGATTTLQTTEEGTPIVTDMHDVDHPSYLTMTSTPTDILFPTHFARLALYCESLFDATVCAATTTDTKVGHQHNGVGHRKPTDATSAVRIELLRQAEFLTRHGPEQVAATSSWLTGYSPMIHDFINCSVLTISVSQPLEK
jgi:Putative S-adenosyl-L-methionine-dependent methyltransferase